MMSSCSAAEPHGDFQNDNDGDVSNGDDPSNDKQFYAAGSFDFFYSSW